MAQKHKSDRQKFCYECGDVIIRHAEFCPRCGAVQKDVREEVIAPKQAYLPAKKSKDRLAASLLAIFLGGFGIHRFYLRQIRLGLLYLAFCWTFIPGLIGVIEGLYWLVNEEEDFDRKFN